MKPRSTEFYTDAYAYAVGYRDGREGNNVEFPELSRFIEHHQTLYRDGYEQGKRDYFRYDHHDQTPAYAPIQSAA